MRGPSLQKTALLSFALHLAAFLIVFLILRQSNQMIMPSPYTVNLVGSDVSKRADRSRHEDVSPKSAVSPVPADTAEKSKKALAEKKEIEKELIAKRIDALRRKNTVKEKINAIKGKDDEIRKLAERRKTISLGAGKEKGDTTSRRSSAFAGGNLDYSAKIMDGIQPYWALPPGAEKKGLEAVVSIRILRDGTVVVQRIEKRSGNRLFDRSALQALAKASPLPRPPYEMEIGVRFHP